MLLTRFPVASGSRRNVEAQTPYGALDVSMPVMSGIEVAVELTGQGNKAQVVLLMVQAAVVRILTSALFRTL
jgi:FixJ family two-component response regulator